MLEINVEENNKDWSIDLIDDKEEDNNDKSK